MVCHTTVNNNYYYGAPQFGHYSYGGHCGCGYDSGFSNAIMGLGIFTSAIRGITNGLEAKKHGANDAQAACIGMGSALYGSGNAIMGNAYDQATHSYWGSMMSSTSSLFGYNPFMMNPFMMGSFMMNPFMMNPYMMGSYSCAPFSFGCLC